MNFTDIIYFKYMNLYYLNYLIGIIRKDFNYSIMESLVKNIDYFDFTSILNINFKFKLWVECRLVINSYQVLKIVVQFIFLLEIDFNLEIKDKNLDFKFKLNLLLSNGFIPIDY